MSKQLGERQQEMVAVAAYFRAEHRGFKEGDQLVDWLEAEAEIEQMLHGQPGGGSAKQSFQQKLENQLEEWNDRLAELKATAQKSKVKARAEIEKLLDAASDKRALAEGRLRELGRRSEDAWEDLKEDTAKAWDELKEAIDRVAARLK